MIDTTPPVIACPAGLTVGQSQRGGTPDTGPLIQAFLSGASAQDACDVAPALTHDAGAFSQLGPTVVTFTAAGFSGNASTCAAVVSVVDTTPPVIDVTGPSWGTCTRAALTVTPVQSGTCDADPVIT